MSQAIEIKVPDIGDYKDVPVIEIHVKPGDRVEKEQTLVTLESDKATMDVPSSEAGVIKEVKVKVGENISEGTVVVLLESEGASAAAPAPAPAPQAAAPAASGGTIQVKVPDIGDYKGVPVIEVHVKVGDRVEKEQSIVTLESDKATMDVPSSEAGIVKEVKVKVGDSISEGDLVIVLESSGAASSPVTVEKSVPATPMVAPASSPNSEQDSCSSAPTSSASAQLSTASINIFPMRPVAPAIAIFIICIFVSYSRLSKKPLDINTTLSLLCFTSLRNIESARTQGLRIRLGIW